MSGTLPGPLRAAIERLLEGVSRNDLARRATRISETYRGGGTSAALAERADFLAYLVTRLPATYAAVATAFAEASRRAEGFAPRSVLDVGAGPGTASFAAVAAWASIERVTMLDASRGFLAIAEELAAAADRPALVSARRLVADAAGGPELPGADLVVAAYALAELPDALAAATAIRLWRAAGEVLVVVEPGTPDGFARIRAVRDVLLGEGATILAPCPHGHRCPIVPPDWCHFAVRLQRLRDHRLVKQADAPFEDEKFAYLAAARRGVAGIAARVLAPPTMGKADLRLKLCLDDGTIATSVVPKRDRGRFARHRRLRWGDAIVSEGEQDTRPTD